MREPNVDADQYMRHSSPTRTTSGAHRPTAPDHAAPSVGTPSSAQPWNSHVTRSFERRTWTPARTGPSDHASVENSQ